MVCTQDKHRFSYFLWKECLPTQGQGLHQYAYYNEKKKGLGLQEVWVKRKSKNKAQEGMLSDSLHLTKQDRLSPRRQSWGGGEIVACSQYLWSSHFMGQSKVQRKSDIKRLPLPIFTPNCHFTYYLQYITFTFKSFLKCALLTYTASYWDGSRGDSDVYSNG